MKTSLGNNLGSLIFVSSHFVMVYFGLSCGDAGMRNLIYASALLSILSGIYALAKTDEQTTKDERPKWIKSYVGYVDFAEVVLVIYWGHWFLALAFSIGALGGAAWRDRKGKPEASK